MDTFLKLLGQIGRVGRLREVQIEARIDRAIQVGVVSVARHGSEERGVMRGFLRRRRASS